MKLLLKIMGENFGQYARHFDRAVLERKERPTGGQKQGHRDLRRDGRKKSGAEGTRTLDI
jgi:hypothetical protein